MKMLSVWLMVVAFVYAPGARADEKKLAAKDVPAAVREAVKKRQLIVETLPGTPAAQAIMALAAKLAP